MQINQEPSDHEHLFVLSTVGQIRNAVSTIQALGLNKVYAVLLYTNQNVPLGARLQEYAQSTGLPAELLEIPRQPGLRLPWRLRRMMAIYQDLLGRFPKAELWMSNSNNHYGYAGHLFASNGRKVNAFEEGMSTYLTADDPRFKDAKRQTLRATCVLCYQTLSQKRFSYRRRALRITRYGYLYVNDTFLGKLLKQAWTRGEADYFYQHWTDFDRVVVAFPDVLDPVRFRAKSLEKLEQSPLLTSEKGAALNLRAKQALEAFDKKNVNVIFVSQVYGFDPVFWGQQIGMILCKKGIFELCVKFHPREKQGYRTSFLRGVHASGVQVYTDATLDKVPLEAIFEASPNRRIIGLTSTALLNIAMAYPNAQVESIGPLLLDKLKGQAKNEPEKYDIFTRDSELLQRVAAQAGVDIAFQSTRALIGGSGPSLLDADLSRVPAGTTVVRVNNFFLEENYNLGSRVDCVYFSADKRALRYYLATLRQVVRGGSYRVKATASHHPDASRLNPIQPFHAMSVTDERLQIIIEDYAQQHGVKPSSGIYAMIYAWQEGATQLYLSGIDFYEGGKKYHTELPPRLKKIMAPNMSDTGYDTRLHARALDNTIMETLEAKGVKITRIDPNNIGNSTLPLAPVCETSMMDTLTEIKTIQTHDWVARSGLHSLPVLLSLRKARQLLPGGSR